MRIIKTILLSVTCYTLLSIDSTFAEANGDVPSSESHAYSQALLKADVNSLMSHFAEDSVLLLQASPSIESKANIHLYFTKLFNSVNIINYTRTSIEIIKMQDKEAEVGQFELVFIGSDDTKRELRGSYLSLWRVNTMNKALIEAELWNFDSHIDFAREFVFTDVPSTITALQAHLPISSTATIELAAYSALIKESVLLRDPVVLSNLYAPNGIILRNSNPPILGFDAISAYWQKHAKEIASMEGLQQRTTRIDESGKFLIQYSSHIAIWRSGEHSGVNTGKHIRIWERQIDGRLKVRLLASAYDE